MEEKTEAFARTIPTMPFDMYAAMAELTLSIATKTLFGIDAGNVTEDVSSALREVMEQFPMAIGPFAPLWRRLPLASTVRFERARDRLDQIVVRLLRERRNASASSEDALSLIMATRDPETGKPLNDAQIRDEAMTLLLAGHETTANALTWAWYLLAQHPRVALRLQEDDDAVYAEAVLKETLRLYPPAWLIGRNACEDVMVGPYCIRKGTTVLLSPLVTHRLGRYFTAPDIFMPERWLRPKPVPEFAYFPFGGGARRCIGETFAIAEALIILRLLSRHYRFEQSRPALVEMRPLVTLRPSGPVWLQAVGLAQHIPR